MNKISPYTRAALLHKKFDPITENMRGQVVEYENNLRAAGYGEDVDKYIAELQKRIDEVDTMMQDYGGTRGDDTYYNFNGNKLVNIRINPFDQEDYESGQQNPVNAYYDRRQSDMHELYKYINMMLENDPDSTPDNILQDVFYNDNYELDEYDIYNTIGDHDEYAKYKTELDKLPRVQQIETLIGEMLNDPKSPINAVKTSYNTYDDNVETFDLPKTYDELHNIVSRMDKWETVNDYPEQLERVRSGEIDVNEAYDEIASFMTDGLKPSDRRLKRLVSTVNWRI